jgi:hypothetical protein
MPRNTVHTELVSSSQVDQAEVPTATLLPEIDWSEMWAKPRRAWLVSRNHDSVTIAQGGNIIRIPADDASEFLNAFERLLGGSR